MSRIITPEEKSSASNVNTLVKAAIKSYVAARNKTQEAGVAILRHASEYGDCDAAKTLCRGIPARERNSLIGWFMMFSPIGVQIGAKQKDDRVRFVNKLSKNYHDFDIEGAIANPWYTDPADANPEPKPLNTLVDFYGIVEKMLKKAIKDADEAADKANPAYDPEAAPEVKENAQELLDVFNKFKTKKFKGDTLMDKAEQAQKPTQAAA